MNKTFPAIPGQRGFASARQLAASDWSTDERNRLVQLGRRVLPHVYRADAGAMAAGDWMLAGWLWAGSPAVCTSTWVLRAVGLECRAAALRYLVPTGVRHRSCAPEASVLTRGDAEAPAVVRASRSWRPASSRVLHGVPAVSVERALADAERFADLSPRAVRALTIQALEEGLVSLRRLHAEMDEGRLNHTAGFRRGVRDFERGAWSLPEAVLSELLRRRCPRVRAIANPRLVSLAGEHVGTPDLYLPEFGVVLQVHSRRHHSGRRDGRDLWSGTLQQDAHYPAHGLTVLGVAPALLRDDPDEFLGLVLKTIEQRRGLPLPPIVVE